MDKEIQDLAWACLPKEERAEQRELYRNAECEFDNGANHLRKNLFGRHNLTSDTEPEEVLMIPISKAREQYAIHRGSHFIQNILHTLFGDKCLPDNPNTPNSGELKSQEADNKPRFKVGDKVIVSHFKKVGVVREIKSHPCIGFNYEVETGKDSYFIVHEVGVEPYTEPETEDNAQHNSWDEDFKKMNECFEKIQKTLSSLCDTFCKLEANVNKLNRL